jgi:hypothetical protein
MIATAPPAGGRKLRHVWLSPEEIRPAPENELVYRPVTLDDPEIHALAESIIEHGLKEPIVITKDLYILSGHRRQAASRLAGLRKIPCRVEDITRSDPEFETLLCEYNRQRVKSFDEVVREQVVLINPEDAYKSLIEHRKAESTINGSFLKIEGEKTRRTISRAKLPMLETAQRIVEELKAYWPLSDRKIHYEFLNDPPLRHASKPESRYVNDRACYQDLCDLLTRARLAGEIPFAAIEDPTRKIQTWPFSRDVGGFVGQQMDKFLRNYFRELQQSQPNHIEIVGEKNTIEGSIKGVAARYCIPYTLGRGYCSLDPRYKMGERFKKSGKGRLILLILSDFDPEGEDIAHSFARSMRDDLGIRNVDAKKVCLTYEQVRERNLPPNFDVKKTGKRSEKFIQKYGESVYELEALHPTELARLLTIAIDSVIDVDAFNQECEAEKEDAANLAGLREQIKPLLMKAVQPNGGPET